MNILSSLNRVLFDIATVPMKQVSDTVAHVYQLAYFVRTEFHVYQDYRNTPLRQAKDDLDLLLLRVDMALKGAFFHMNDHSLALEFVHILQNVIAFALEVQTEVDHSRV